MGKNIKITEEQLRLITKTTIKEGQQLDALKKRLEDFRKELVKMHEIKDNSNELFEFLDDVRESGIVNMYQSADLLWSGSEWISKWADLHAPHLSDNEYDEEESNSDFKEAYQRVLDKADKIRDMIIRIAFARAEKQDGENAYETVNRHVRTVSKDILILWMKHFGTSMGRMKTEVDEIARTLAKARKHNRGTYFPKSAIKANPERFNPSVRIDESFFFGNMTPDTMCDNCGHGWERRPEDTDPELCHMCGYDQSTEEFDLDKVIEFWTNKKED